MSNHLLTVAKLAVAVVLLTNLPLNNSQETDETFLPEFNLTETGSDLSNDTKMETTVETKAEDARHSMDYFHFDFSQTGFPLGILTILLFITTIKPSLRLPVLRHIPESVVLMGYGFIISFVIMKALGTSKLIGEKSISEITMPPSLFFIFLLPAIVSDAGLSMQKGEFFESLPKTLIFAVFGTILNTVLLSISIWLCQSSYILKDVPFLHFFLYSTLMSAVDPVSVLSTFSEIDVKRPLFTLIFGESLLNDAITIVLYRTALNVINYNRFSSVPLTFLEILSDCFLQFCMVSFCGVLIGLFGAIAGVLLIKKLAGYQILLPILQLIIPYMLYLITESFHYSGILACIVSSMFMSHYMKSNVCVEMEFVVFTVSKSLSSIAEMIIFIFLGLSSVAHSHKWDLNFILISFASCTVIRAIMVLICSFMSNSFSKKQDRIEFKDQIIVTHAGIRGAVCFGLVQSIDLGAIPEKEYFVTTTIMMIALTSLFQGCTIKLLMKALKIEGDNGIPTSASRVMQIYKKFDKNVFRPLLTSKSMYLPTDETFRNLGLPKAVSTALRIGERSHNDLLAHEQASTVSVARPTVSPFDKEQGGGGAVDEELLTLQAQPSTGRRTPVQRASIYSRHLFLTRPQSPRISEDEENTNYMTCPASIQKKRPTFNPQDMYNQSTFTGAMNSGRAYKRHNSTGDGGTELKNILSEPPREKKISRTIVSGTKTFVVDNDELSAIDESPKKPDRVVFQTPEDHQDSE